MIPVRERQTRTLFTCDTSRDHWGLVVEVDHYRVFACIENKCTTGSPRGCSMFLHSNRKSISKVL